MSFLIDIGTVFAANASQDLPPLLQWMNNISSFMTKILKTFELTAKFHLTHGAHGANYPPIEKDITFWCFKP